MGQMGTAPDSRFPLQNPDTLNLQRLGTRVLWVAEMGREFGGWASDLGLDREESLRWIQRLPKLGHGSPAKSVNTSH